MKKLKFPLFLLGVFIVFIACEQEFDITPNMSSLTENQKSISELKTRAVSNVEREFMPLDSIPKWVKAKTTSEEYELWKIMSTRYQINYSFLDTNLRDDQKSELYNTLRIICQKIEEGSLGQRDLGYFVVQIMKKKTINSIERLSKSEVDDVIHQSYPEIIYRAKGANEARVVVIASFQTNSDGTEISKVIGAKAYPDGFDAVKFEGSCTTGDFGPLILSVECAGTLTFKDTVTETASESFSRSMNIKVLPG